MGRYSDPKKYKSGGKGKMKEYKVPKEGGTNIDLFNMRTESAPADKTRVVSPELSPPVIPSPPSRWDYNIPDTEGEEVDLALSIERKNNRERLRLYRQRISQISSDKKKSKPLKVAAAKPKTY